MNISIIGSGSFGTSIAIHLSPKAQNINIYSNDSDIVNEININRTNKNYLQDIDFIPMNISSSTNLREVIEDTQYIILAVPSHAIRSVSKTLRPYINENQIIVNLAKGLDENTLSRLSEVIKEEANTDNIVVLSGPSHAEEIVKNIPTTIVASSHNLKLAEQTQQDFSTNTLRIYTNPDVVGVEIGGAAKNIIALASGILDGLGYGDNAKAALMVRGINEIIQIGKVLGGSETTFNGLSGMGDLIVTCTSKHSRNKRAGELLSKGLSLDETLQSVGMVVEGVNACDCFYKLSIQHNIELPITTALYNVLYKHSNPKDEIHNLLSRDNKNEFN